MLTAVYMRIRINDTELDLDELKLVPIVVLLIGLLMAIISFCGCFGALTESMCMLITVGMPSNSMILIVPHVSLVCIMCVGVAADQARFHHHHIRANADFFGRHA